MNTCPEHLIEYMHDYLDGDISRDQEQELKQHLQSCADCKQLMNELSETITFIKSASHIEAPPHFEASVMDRLPKPKNRVGMQKWIRRHPFFVAAAVFCLFMSTALLGIFQDDQQFSVTKQPNLVVEGQTVIVPKGEVVKGDIVVKNGDLVVEGEVDGNVTIINGKYMASTAVVSGQIEEIDEAFEWLWYKIKGATKSVMTFTESETK
ncbi:MAG: zf-HC2 domain-containing protein [Lysinibacillus sp.]